MVLRWEVEVGAGILTSTLNDSKRRPCPTQFIDFPLLYTTCSRRMFGVTALSQAFMPCASMPKPLLIHRREPEMLPFDSRLASASRVDGSRVDPWAAEAVAGGFFEQLVGSLLSSPLQRGRLRFALRGLPFGGTSDFGGLLVHQLFLEDSLLPEGHA